MAQIRLGVLPPPAITQFLTNTGEAASVHMVAPPGVLLAEIVQLPFVDTFTDVDDAAWDPLWQPLGGSPVTTIQENEGELSAPTGVEGRVGLTHANLQTIDGEVLWQIRFTEFANQGLWLWLRQNGGYLTGTVPQGQGYGCLLQGGEAGAPQMEHWTELNGVLVQRAVTAAIPTITDGVAYNIRFQVEQTGGATSTLRSRVWPAQEGEPSTWDLETARADAALQNQEGGTAVGVQNYNGFVGSIRVD